MHKNTLTDQIDLGHLISKHEMFCLEKTVPYKDRHSIFGKTNVTGQIFKIVYHQCMLSFHLESLFAG
jgi:hypothetical protein